MQNLTTLPMPIPPSICEETAAGAEGEAGVNL